MPTSVVLAAARMHLGRRHRLRGRLHLLHQPIDDLLILGGVLGVGAELGVARAAREIAAARRRAGHRSRRDAVAVDVQVARELLHLLELGGAEHLAAIGAIAVVPGEARAHPVVHPDVEIGHDEHRRLESLREIERFDGEREALARIRREERDVLRVAVRQIRDRQQIALLRARRHAGGRAGALNVEEDAGNLGVVRESDELAHQRDARARRRRERRARRPIPRRSPCPRPPARPRPGSARTCARRSSGRRGTARSIP